MHDESSTVDRREAGPQPHSSSVPLTSLAPLYVQGQHKPYLNRLEAAIKDSKNLNIALTGRYGSGKSSVLDQFEADNPSTTLRLAISTLGPNDEATSPTNRIQKELVKQLVYSASPKTLRHSRFRRSIALTWQRALSEATIATLLLGALLTLLGWLPPVTGTSDTHSLLVRILAWVILAALVIGTGTVLRLLTHEKFVVSDVSAGGATVTLSERTPTYFDEYLDDIVNYFDTENTDIVIFEDLDRFDDPHIFEALRELNTLLNNTKARTKPLRFVYAVRDSLFEKLGTDVPSSPTDDEAASETVRANRTKFFDIVIPMVPFISHRNARDLLVDLLNEARITGIERPLLNIVAQHSTDMRLLRNMRNEYLMFAERLLETDKVAPGLTPSNLFALVAYKNFHLGDFENISRRTSKLDTLYDYRRQLVRDSIANLEHRRRDLVSGRERLRTRAPLAQKLGAQLGAFTSYLKSTTPHNQWPTTHYKVDDHEFTPEQIGTYEFWQRTENAAELQILVSSGGSKSRLASITNDQLRLLIPEGFESGTWDDIDETETRAELTRIDTAIAFLRSADFADLAEKPEYTYPNPTHTTPFGSTNPETPSDNRTFTELIDSTITSQLARELIKRRYLDRNFALYAAQFYGNFTGTDVANFIVQHVQTETMEIGYRLDRNGAVANLLDETDEDFPDTVVAYNTDIVNYLLATEDPRAVNIVNRLATTFDDDARTFLSSYFTTGTEREKLAAALAHHRWRHILEYLSTEDAIPDDVRHVLVDAALAAVDTQQVYDLPIEFNTYLVDNYSRMPAFTRPQEHNVIGKVVTILERAHTHLPELDILDADTREVIVNRSLYELTAQNLRTATHATNDISFERILSHPAVYAYCINRPDAYLAIIDNDAATPSTITSPHTLAQVLTDIADLWSDEHLTRVLAGAASTSMLEDLNEAPTSTWTALADAKLFHPSFANIVNYIDTIGAIDDALAGLLEHVGTIDITDNPADPTDRTPLAMTILNAHTILAPTTRIGLVLSLDADLPLTITQIAPEPTTLLAQLIEHGLVPDDYHSFAHFHQAGWPAIKHAIATSAEITSFLTPSLLTGMVTDALRDAPTANKIGHMILAGIDNYIPDDDPETLTAAAELADIEQFGLTPAAVLRIATATSNTKRSLRLLRNSQPPATADQIVAVFSVLDENYKKISHPGTEFTVPHDHLHNALLTTLQNENVCTYRKKPRHSLYTVNVK
ncbi:hypothetical protein AC1659_15160 [Rhodococcus erythropolis]|uniref:YobI family P-loop NTPase n=1 Tax=Rhodococcus erythropolis TaxID=1833 RepID=UPI001BA987DA|nr:hypothetical protein [Rhodococcus erythropolis]MBS2990614.1 hypothetical protein [Rhodococcus erythropolis]